MSILKTCVHGRNDGSCSWYFRVCNELIKFGTRPLLYAPTVFYWRNNNDLHGLLVVQVDYICWGRTKLFEKELI